MLRVKNTRAVCQLSRAAAEAKKRETEREREKERRKFFKGDECFSFLSLKDF
jgi:hypothetical protein